MRSRLTCSPAARAACTARSTLAGSWVRSRVRSTCGTADCMPSETRVKPASASTSSPSGVTESGLASVVTSASGASPNRVADAVQHPGEVGGRAASWGCRRPRTRCRPAGSAPSTCWARVSSRRAASAKVATLAPSTAQLGQRVGVEVAVAAADRAERDVQVDAERMVPEGLRVTPATAGRRTAPGHRRAGRWAWLHPRRRPLAARTRRVSATRRNGEEVDENFSGNLG